MPPKVERCVSDFMSDPKNQKKWPDAGKRRQAAFAICNSAIKNEASRGYILELAGVQLEDVGGGNQISRAVHLLPLGEFEHPVYGDIVIDDTKLDDYISNFDRNVVGSMLMVDYEHRRNKAEGGRAAGWFIGLGKDERGLTGDISWTPRAAASIKDGEYKYMSIEYTNEYTPEKKGSKTYSNVLLGAAVTNNPFMRSLSPINFAELDGPFDPPEGKFSPDEVDYRAAYTSTARCLNCKFFQPGTSSDDADADGDGGTCLVVDGVIDPDWVCDCFAVMVNDTTMMDQEREEVKMEEFLKRLRVTLGLDDDADESKILDAFAAKVAEKQTPAATPEEEKARRFAEDYPEEAATLALVTERNRTLEVNDLIGKWSRAKFSLPPSLFEEIGKIRRKMSGDIAVAFDDFMVKLGETGLVRMGERGGGDPQQGKAGAREHFLTLVKQYQDEHEGVKFVDAVQSVAHEHQDLAAEYYRSRPKLSGAAAEVEDEGFIGEG